MKPTTTAPAPPPGADALFAEIAGVVCDQDRGESPFGWSELPPPDRNLS
ncbi:hypothetical protein VSR01_17425 [Actinacidiphila sp. DG2A-62]|nr:hypothetical protein [Actinacidiphila sp. DG2A-62]MEC3995220.1 hypothetical protein [Actinacidiphila sp. DG2A-62]